MTSEGGNASYPAPMPVGGACHNAIMTPKEDGSQAWFIADTPLSDPDRDSFGHPDVANNLLAMLRERRRGRQMIGLLGPFGVGKSSVIELLGQTLAGDEQHSLIRISAERHEIESFHRSFVFSVAEALVDRDLAPRSQVEQVIARLEYATTQSWADIRLSGVGRLFKLLSSRLRTRLGRQLIRFGGAVLLLLGVVTGILTINGFFETDTVSRATAWLSTIIGSMAATFTAVPLASLFTSAFQQVDPLRPGQHSSMRPRAEAADEYERVFAALVGLIDTRLVIAVDDVDRLDQREILPALNAIRSFQLTVSVDKQPAFVVSLDDTVIAPALVAQRRSHGGDSEDAERLVDEYLNRLFTLRQMMPLHAKRDLRAYARELLKVGGHRGADKLGTSLDTVLNILIHDDVQSPRHVIRLLNAFFADYRLATRRELSSTGKRAISSGLVSSAPAVLARMTVLKNDFPAFFAALVQDTRLLGDVEDDVRGSLDEEGVNDLEAKAGVDRTSEQYRSLKRFIGRTATWTEPIDDLLPFLYLGQDSLERSMGSADARRALSVLSNRQIAEFGRLLEDALAADDERRGAYVESIVDAVRSLEGLELANALATIAENAPKSVALSGSIAEAFADGLVRSPAVDLSTAGLALLLSAVTSEQHLSEITQAIRRVPAEDGPRAEWIRSVLDHDQHIAPYSKALQDVQAALEVTMKELADAGELDALEAFVGHLRPDSEPGIAEIVLASTLDGFAEAESDLTDDFPATAAAAASAFDKGDTSDRLQASLRSAIRAGVTTNGAMAALNIVEVMDVAAPQHIADLTYDWLTSVTEGPRDALVDEVRSGHVGWAEWLLVHTLQFAAHFTAAWGKKKSVPLSRQIAEVLALLIEKTKTIHPSGNAIARELLSSRPQDSGPIVQAASTMLSKKGEELDEDEQELFESILANRSGLSEEALDTLRGALHAALQLGANADARAQIIALLPQVRDDAGWSAWADLVIAETAAAATSTLSSCEAAADVILAVAPTTPSDQSAEAVLNLVRSTMLPYRHNSLAVEVVGRFAWPAAYRSRAIEAVAQVLSAGTVESLTAIFGQLSNVARGSLPVPAVAQLLAAGISELEPRATARVLRHLPLGEALETAVRLGDDASEEWTAALDSATAQEVSVFVNDAPSIWVGSELADASHSRLLFEIASREPQAFADAAAELVADFLANDDVRIVPERLGEVIEASPSSAEPIARAIEAALDGAAHEASVAIKLLPAIETSPILDRALSDGVAKALRRWSRDVIDRELSLRIAREARRGSATKKAALAAIGPGGPRKEPAKEVFRAVRSALRND